MVSEFFRLLHLIRVVTATAVEPKQVSREMNRWLRDGNQAQQPKAKHLINVRHVIMSKFTKEKYIY